MNFGICNLSVVPVRLEPSDKSQMTTQLLFGDIFKISETYNNWCKIIINYDDYEGWIDNKQFLSLSKDTYNKINSSPKSITIDLVYNLTDITQNIVFPIVTGSSLPNIVNNSFYINNNKFVYNGHIITDVPKTDKKIREKVVEYAYKYQNTPYLWGGKTPFGIDCSGFTQMVYKMAGIKLLRDTNKQSTQGKTISFLSEAKQGAIAFFDNEENEIIHVGILLKDNKIIHASGKVYVDIIDHHGIYNANTKKYSHKLRIIKRVV